VPLVACSLHALLKVPPTAWIVRCRGNLGLASAGNHIVYLALIMTLLDVSGRLPLTELEIWAGPSRCSSWR